MTLWADSSPQHSSRAHALFQILITRRMRMRSAPVLCVLPSFAADMCCAEAVRAPSPTAQ
jgi:hypothetical protein